LDPDLFISKVIQGEGKDVQSKKRIYAADFPQYRRLYKLFSNEHPGACG